MSRYIATRAIRGAHTVVNEFEGLLQKALTKKEPRLRSRFRTPLTTCRSFLV